MNRCDFLKSAFPAPAVKEESINMDLPRSLALHNQVKVDIPSFMKPIAEAFQ